MKNEEKWQQMNLCYFLLNYFFFNDVVLLRRTLRHLLKWLRFFPFCIVGEGTQGMDAIASYGESTLSFLYFTICLFPFWS